MTRITVTLVLSLVICSSAHAAFSVGIADPGSAAIPRADISGLGLSMERRSVIWSGESSFTGSLNWTPGLRQFVAVYSSAYVPATAAERDSYCSFVISILRRYPSVHDVIVWNEPNLSYFWGLGTDAYAQLLQACSPRVRAAGARVWAPGMSPSTTAGVADFARAIARRGTHLIDGWDQHDYSDYSLTEKIAAVRTAFGWNVPLLVGESGGAGASDPAYFMRKAYCAGAIGWLNFNLRDDGDWIPTGLERADGTPKRQFSSFASEIARIHSGQADCGQPTHPRLLGPPVKTKHRDHADAPHYGASIYLLRAN